MRKLQSTTLAGVLVLCLALLVGCFGAGSASKGYGDPWPLAADAVPLDTLLPDEDLCQAALRVLGSPKPWTLSGTDPAEGTDLIEGLPNELADDSALAFLFGLHPWSDAYKTIERGSGFEVIYALSDYVPEGYVRVEAFVRGVEEEGYVSTFQFVVIMREEDAVPVLASMTSITTDGFAAP